MRNIDNGFENKEVLGEILKAKKMKGYSWDKLADTLPISGNALRVAFDRESVDALYLDEICKLLGIDYEDKKRIKNNRIKREKLSFNSQSELITWVIDNKKELLKNPSFKMFLKNIFFDKENQSLKKRLKRLEKKVLNS